MAKKSSEVGILEKIQGNAWVQHCKKVAGCNQAGLAKVVSAVPDKDLWSKYKNGNAKPLKTTVQVVDQVLPGTAQTWFNGPEGLPLWAILGGDKEVCNDFVNTEFAEQVSRSIWWLLSNPKKSISNMSIAEKVQAMLEASIPAWYWIRTTEDGEEPFPEDEEDNIVVDLRFADRNKYFLKLDELINKEPNALALAYAEGKTKYKNAKHSFGIADYRILEKKRLAAFISLIVLCGNSKELGAIRAFLKKGIYQALIDIFGTDIAEYVNSPAYI